ncbi:MAG TPA: PAS domain-containing sensor histidine kinase [Gemmatimonadaceae bacterium]|nr:PAS domain-containing sensor histidine kinase [Gemmatimonadaceae bacterium]
MTDAPHDNGGHVEPAVPHTGTHTTPASGTVAPHEYTPSMVERLHRLLVENVRDYAIFALDPRGHIVSWNAGAARIKGYTASEILGEHFSIFYPPEDLATDKPGMELRVASKEGRFEDEGWRLRKDGTRFWANVIITALFDRDGTLRGFGKVTRDLTERRAAEEQAIADARRLAAAEAANKAKAEFLAAMSHELRTPLNAIGGYAQLLATGLGGPVTEEQQAYLGRIRRSQQHLLAIITDLLNFSRIEAGQLSYDIQPVSLPEVIDGVVQMVEPQLTTKHLTLEAASTSERVVAIADRAKVEQILVNLLSNSLKFTESGGKISISYIQEANCVGVRVIDTGIGIPADRLEDIFEPFVQVGRSLTSAHEGTGLGLAISRDLARGMGGELTASSTPGQGSEFRLTLPEAPTSR